MCFGGRVLRESRRPNSTRRESGRAGISARSLPRVGGRQPDCGRGRHPHGEHPDWAGAEREGRRAREYAEAVQTGAGRTDWVGAAVVELDSCGRHCGRHPSHPGHRIAFRAGESGRAESGPERRIHASACFSAPEACCVSGPGLRGAAGVRQDGRGRAVACQPARRAGKTSGERLFVPLSRAADYS